MIKKIKEYKQLKDLRASFLIKQAQVQKLMDRSHKAKKAVDKNGVNFRIEDRIKYYDLKLAELKHSSLLIRILSFFI